MIRLDAKEIGCLALTFNYGMIPPLRGIGGLIPPGIKNELWFKSVRGLNKELKRIVNLDYEHYVYTMLRSNCLMLIKRKAKNIMAFSFYIEPVTIFDGDIDQVDDIAVLICPEYDEAFYSIYSFAIDKELIKSFLERTFFLPAQLKNCKDIHTKIKESELEMIFYNRKYTYRKNIQMQFYIAQGNIYFYNFSDVRNSTDVVCVDSFEEIIKIAKNSIKL